MLLATAVSAALAATGHADTVHADTVHGVLAGKTEWKGVVVIDGDVSIPPEGELVISRGTQVKFRATDVSSLGFSPQVEIRVEGNLRILGTEQEPVIFSPERDRSIRPEGAEYIPYWHGIVILPTEDPRERVISGARFRSAFAGVQVPSGTAMIRGCVFEGCGVGVEVGSAFRDRDHVELRGGARVQIQQSRFRACYTGVYAQGDGRAEIQRCVFDHCRVGVGNHRDRTNWPLEIPGFEVDRSDFFGNREGVHGPGRVLNSIFVDNGIALRPSRFHHELSVRLDFLSYEHNLFHGAKQQNLFGETAVGVAFEGDPLLKDVDALANPWPPLPQGLALGASSPARGAALDGGDLGATGAVGNPSAGPAWQPDGVLLTRALVLGGGKGPEAAETPLPATPGKRYESAWWATADADEDGVFPWAEWIRVSGGEGWIAFPLACSAGELKLEVNGDFESLRVFREGELIFESPGPRRFDEEGIPCTMAVDKGTTLLLMHVVAREGEARLGVACAGEAKTVLPGQRSAGKPRISKVTLVDGGRFLDLKVSKPLHWDIERYSPRVRIVNSDGGTVVAANRLKTSVPSTTTIRVGPLPGGLNGSFKIEADELVSPAGVDYTGPTTAKAFKVGKK